MLKKSITLWQGIALYVGAVIGSGILILPGMTAGIAGANALYSWIGMVLFSIPLAYTFALLAKEYPCSGGISTFVEKAFGRYASAIIGWFYFIAAIAGQVIVPLTGGIYVIYALQLDIEIAYIIAGIILISAVIINYFGIKLSSKVQLMISSLTLLILLFTIISALPLIDINNIKPSLTSDNITLAGKAGMFIFWSFFGWEAIASLAPEFKNPKRDITRATWGAIIIVGIVYLGSALAVIGTQSYSTETSTIEGAMNNASLVQVMTKTTGIHGGYATAFVALLISVGTTNVFAAGISRLGYSLAREKLAPSWFDYIHKRYHTPTHMIIFIGIFATGGLLIAYIFKISLETLVFIPNSLGIASYVFGGLAGVKLLDSKIGKIMAALTTIVCLAAYPFVGIFIQIPLIVGIACCDRQVELNTFC
ncbi:APC family permease [Bacillus norwichensis]|uniref:Amino acid permease n=1 Tax=Bacillus norwichensis TaxID=2762217 RepID=A0ABR8VR79_9BACI|nr:amino acid permease [Bacillus norwichensis]MBD8007257.1 amino acid permease [Bacillus norwichensis]